MKLESKVAVVTGAASGVGKATLELFASEGGNVVGVDVNVPAGEAVVAEVARTGAKAKFIAADVSSSEHVRDMVSKAVAAFDRIDILFNNAGIEIVVPIHEMSEEDWDAVLNTNLKGAFLCSKYVVPHMIRNGGGVIINNSSLMAGLALPGASAYCASKAGLLGLTKAMALDLGRYNIRVNAIRPGSVDTPLMWAGVQPADLKEVRRICNEAQPIGRVGRPEEIARAVLFLASEDASFITGADFVIDGGLGTKLATLR